MTITAEEVLDMVTQFGWEYFRTYPGIYRAVVARNDDPEKRGRIQAQVGAVHSEPLAVWVKPAFDGAGAERGTFWPPEVGDTVYVSFAQGRPERPEVYFGGWFGTRGGNASDPSEVPNELGYSGDYPDIRGLVTRMGHVLLFGDEAGNERVELIWNKPDAGDEALSDRTKTAARPGSASSGGGTAHVKFTPNGSIEIQDNNASSPQKVTLDAQAGQIVIEDANGNRVTLGPSGAKIESTSIDLGGNATEPAVLGQAWLKWAIKHQHSTSTGPSGPPIEPPLPTILSNTVKVKA